MPRRSLALVLVMVVAALVAVPQATQAAPRRTPPGQAKKAPPIPAPQAVIAHVDTGINPYHAAFRDRSPLAYRHPSTYLRGYPADATALHLTLDAPSWQAAFAKDRKIWDGLLAEWQDDPASVAGRMFWVPGTRIVGAVRLSPGGIYCPAVTDAVQPSGTPAQAHSCPDYPILDDHGHGTMTASRMAGAGASLCDQCRILSIEGLGDKAVQLAAEAGWVDVQSNSWGFIAPNPAIWAVDRASGAQIVEHLEDAAAAHLVYFASGNGFNGAFGFTPWPTQVAATLVQGAVWVGAHDNGRVAPWSGAPAHLVADGFAPLAARNRELAGIAPTAFACCTSTSAPYAAGAGAAAVLEARRILGDESVGVRGGVVARGPAGRVRRGPLVDGVLTLDELKALVRHSAEPVPGEGRHDGDLHWLGRPDAPSLLPYGPGANPYCAGCFTAPVRWSAVPAAFPAHTLVGYGSVNERTLDVGRRVLAGDAPAPDRATVDKFFADEAAVRRILHHPDKPV